MRRILKRTAMNLELEVTGCADAEHAIEALQKDSFPLIVLDWMLPGMDGVELCRLARKMSGGKKSFIIMITAKDKHEDLLEVLEAGADDYIAKPVNVKLLKTRLTVAKRMAQKLQKTNR
jgi:DNA-binding response OmpR family regulator